MEWIFLWPLYCCMLFAIIISGIEGGRWDSTDLLSNLLYFYKCWSRVLLILSNNILCNAMTGLNISSSEFKSPSPKLHTFDAPLNDQGFIQFGVACLAHLGHTYTFTQHRT